MFVFVQIFLVIIDQRPQKKIWNVPRRIAPIFKRVIFFQLDIAKHATLFYVSISRASCVHQRAPTRASNRTSLGPHSTSSARLCAVFLSNETHHKIAPGVRLVSAYNAERVTPSQRRRVTTTPTAAATVASANHTHALTHSLTRAYTDAVRYTWREPAT